LGLTLLSGLCDIERLSRFRGLLAGNAIALLLHEGSGTPTARDVRIDQALIAGGRGAMRCGGKAHQGTGSFGRKTARHDNRSFIAWPRRADYGVGESKSRAANRVAKWNSCCCRRKARFGWVRFRSYDREVEAYGVTVSKQMCEKPVAAEFWALSAKM